MEVPIHHRSRTETRVIVDYRVPSGLGLLLIVQTSFTLYSHLQARLGDSPDMHAYLVELRELVERILRQVIQLTSQYAYIDDEFWIILIRIT